MAESLAVCVAGEGETPIDGAARKRRWPRRVLSRTVGSFPPAHLKSLQDYPPRQGADSLSMKKAIDEAIKKMVSPQDSSNGSLAA